MEDRGRLKLDSFYLINSDATGPFPELLWSLPLQQARFPDFRLERVASRPSQSPLEISDVMEAMQLPVHSGGNRLGISPNFPCRPHGHLRRSNPTTSS